MLEAVTGLSLRILDHSESSKDSNLICGDSDEQLTTKINAATSLKLFITYLGNLDRQFLQV